MPDRIIVPAVGAAIKPPFRLTALLDSARRWMQSTERRTHGPKLPPGPPPEYRPLRLVQLCDEVGRRLFDEYTHHLKSERGHEETGWLLLGYRTEDTAIITATLPAGEMRDAGDCHVAFNSEAQAFVAAYLVRRDPTLKLLGVVHTHPGSLRRPSSGDYRGDIEWVERLVSAEGVFGIGTNDALGEPTPAAGVATHPEAHVQIWEGLRFSWYALAREDRNYRNLPIELTLGADQAAWLRPVWNEIERHAERLNSLSRMLRDLRLDVTEGEEKPALAVLAPIPEKRQILRMHLEEDRVKYILETPDGAFAVDLDEPRVDRGLYLLLAELSG